VFRSSKLSKKSKRQRVRALPWAALAQAVFAIRRHWQSLSEKDRARVSGLVRESGGRWGNLSSKERAELRKLAGKLDSAPRSEQSCVSWPASSISRASGAS